MVSPAMHFTIVVMHLETAQHARSFCILYVSLQGRQGRQDRQAMLLQTMRVRSHMLKAAQLHKHVIFLHWLKHLA